MLRTTLDLRQYHCNLGIKNSVLYDCLCCILNTYYSRSDETTKLDKPNRAENTTFYQETNLNKIMLTYQFSYFLSLFTMPCSSICVRMARFSSSEPSQMCKKSGWHRLTLVSTKSLTAGLRVLRSPCRTLVLLWFWDWSWGGMVTSVWRSERKVRREETRRASQRGWLSWSRG